MVNNSKESNIGKMGDDKTMSTILSFFESELLDKLDRIIMVLKRIGDEIDTRR